jgi:hypothetical protein
MPDLEALREKWEALAAELYHGHDDRALQGGPRFPHTPKATQDQWIRIALDVVRRGLTERIDLLEELKGDFETYGRAWLGLDKDRKELLAERELVQEEIEKWRDAWEWGRDAASRS